MTPQTGENVVAPIRKNHPKGDFVFAPLLRHRYWTLGAVIALLAAGLVFAFATDGPTFSTHANTDTRTVQSHDATPPVYGSSIQDQLKAQGYRLAGTDSYDSSDAHRVINGETWKTDGDQPMVFLTDAYPGKPGTFVIDTVSYDQTATYKQFWCVPPSLTDADNLAATLNAAASERTNIVSGVHKPVASDVPGTDKVDGATLCYMK